MTDARDGDGVDAQAGNDVDGAAWVERLRSGSRLHDDVDDNDVHDGDDAHRERVRDSTEHALTEQAEVRKRLKDADGADEVDAGTPAP